VRSAGDDAGSAPAEFVMVGSLLVLLALGVMQVGLSLHVRTTAIDAAAEGARYGALAGNTPDDGAERTRDLIGHALGNDYARDVVAGHTDDGGMPVAVVTVRAPLPLIGLVGMDDALEVSGHAVVETVH
jgi:Flp pilus assembly protein TadG